MDRFDLLDVLSVYFLRLFPFDDIYQWLTYDEEQSFAFREFALNFEGERYLRNQSYNHINDLKYQIRKHHPVKIDIGAVYNARPLNRIKEKVFYPVQRELVFDLDITDYDDIRSCCSGTDICLKCWKFMSIAVKILDSALKEDFGFNHVLWVFSGRRGIHGWVCDKRARFLKAQGRFAVANYLQVVSGGEYKKKKVIINDSIHPSLKRALKVIEPIFTEMCVEEQNILGTEEKVLKFLGIIDEEMRTEVKQLLNEYETSYSKWKAFVNFFKDQIELKSEKWCKTPFLIEEIMLQYAYPRLDIYVTIGMNHLLKSPFCVHPKTGKIGVPLDVENIQHFDPHKVPSIIELLEEIDTFDAKVKAEGMSIAELKKIKDAEKTSLNKYLCIFKKFLHSLKSSSEESIEECDIRPETDT